MRPLPAIAALIGAGATIWIYVNAILNPPPSPVDDMAYVFLVAVGLAFAAFVVVDRRRVRRTEQNGKHPMSNIKIVDAGGYRYIESVFQFSGGVAAEPGFAIERAHFAQPLTLAEGFAAIEAHLGAIGRPTTALCACELRSPAPSPNVASSSSTRPTFKRWNGSVSFMNGINPVARTNVCPRLRNRRTEHSRVRLYRASDTSRTTFVVSGGAEAAEGAGDYHDSIVRSATPASTACGTSCAMSQPSRRAARGTRPEWQDATDVRVYTPARRRPADSPRASATGHRNHGVKWYDASPPVQDCDYEMDARTVLRDIT